MAFNVQFYTFSKKANSTARPSSGPTTYSCVANDPLDILHPVIKIKAALSSATPAGFNYMYIPNLSRYYWITSWEVRDGLWWAYGKIDVLASFKTEIGSSSLYVFRAAYNWDGRIVDTLYPTINRTKTVNVALPKVFSIGGAPYTPIPKNSGSFFVNVISDSGTERYAMSSGNFSAFVKEIYSNSFYEDILTNFGADQYPEAKVAINPAQYLSDIKWVPAPLESYLSADNAWAFPYYIDVTSIKVGTVTVTPTTLGTWKAYKMETISESVYTIIRDSSMGHPQADERGDWLELSPYSSYELFYPPFGLIDLDPAAISTHDNINIRTYFDSKAVTVQLEVTVSNENDPRSKEIVIYRNSSNVGIDVPFSAVMVPGTSFTQLVQSGLSGAASAAGSVLSGNVIGAVTGTVGMIGGMVGTAISGRIPHVSSSGSFGSAAALGGNPALQVTHWYMADDDLAGRGRPLCQVKQLSTIPGYIMADPDELSLPATDGELEEIRGIISGGFFYE